MKCAGAGHGRPAAVRSVKREGLVTVHTYTLVCTLLTTCTHVCELHSFHSVGETLAVGPLPLIPRVSCGREGFLHEEGFRREDLGLMEGSSPSGTFARLFASSQPQFPCLSEGDISIYPRVGCTDLWSSGLPSAKHRVGTQSVLGLRVTSSQGTRREVKQGCRGFATPRSHAPRPKTDSVRQRCVLTPRLPC